MEMEKTHFISGNLVQIGGVLAIPRPHMHRKHVLLLKCHQLVITERPIF